MDPFQKNPGFLARFREGEAAALSHVYKTYERPLRTFILRGFAFRSEGRQLYFGGAITEPDLEDIIQETFRRAFGARARAAYDGIRPYKNYLFTIARNAVITDLSVRRRQIPVGEALMRDAPSDDLSPLESWIVSQRAVLQEGQATSDDRIESLEIYSLLASFLESLSTDDERFFRVRFLTQCSQEKTAKRLGCNRARVRKLEARLRRAFLCHVKDSGYLQMRSEGRKVRRPDDPDHQQRLFERSRVIWRERRAHEENELLYEAA